MNPVIDTRRGLKIMQAFGLAETVQVNSPSIPEPINAILRNGNDGSVGDYVAAAADYSLRALAEDIDTAGLVSGQDVTVGERSFQVVRIDPPEAGMCTVWLRTY